MTIPRLELCAAQLLAHLLLQVKELFHIPFSKVYSWTDSTVVLSWLVGNPRRFKTFVGNRVSDIVDCVPPDCWRHVEGLDNPADCASRGLLPSELLEHELWWSGPQWLHFDQATWPTRYVPRSPSENMEEVRNICLASSIHLITPVIPIDRYSSFSKLKSATGWLIRFISNCRLNDNSRVKQSFLSISELQLAENYWLSLSQRDCFLNEIKVLKANEELDRSSSLIPLSPMLDSSGLLRISGRQGAMERHMIRYIPLSSMETIP